MQNNNETPHKQPCGCDTFVVFPPVSPAGKAIFGKNSDRPNGEKQSITRYPRRSYTSTDPLLRCTYVDIPQSNETAAVLLSQIDWMWGCEMGANEYGVVIGNEAVWTVEPMEKRALLGMDLVRLGLERGKTPREAVHVITSLLETYGQGGACAENDPSFTYHNSFLIANCKEAWVLETAGRNWVAERVTQPTRNISNGLTIRTSFDLSSKGLKEYAKQKGYWDGREPFDFAACFSYGGVDELSDSRQVCGEKLLKKHHTGIGTLTSSAMMEILRDHKSGICMHGGFETTASMVSELDSNSNKTKHWMTGKPNPCKSEFLLQDI